MTTYTAIPNGDIDQDSPFTQPLLTLMRDNPISIAEGDSSVADSLRPLPLLGTLTTSSGATQTLSGLTLTNYRFLRIVMDGTAFANASTGVVQLAGNTITASASSGTTYGILIVDLTGGPCSYATGIPSVAAGGFNTSITTASTSITFTVTGTSPAFNGGTIRVYGEK